MASKTRKQDADGEIVKVRRRQARSALTREKIIDAAAIEFASAGFDGATTRSIAARAQVPHGLLIYHFETKLSVWRAVTENALRHFHDEFTKLRKKMKDCDAVTHLRAAQRLFVQLSAKRPELNWILSHNVAEDAPTLKSLITEIIGPDIDLGIDLIRKAQVLGRYVEGDPAHLHFLFIGAASRIFMLRGEIERTMGEARFDDEFLERHLELCQRLFFLDRADAKPRMTRIVVHHAEIVLSISDHEGPADEA